jgi:hypothetical protein
VIIQGTPGGGAVPQGQAVAQGGGSLGSRKGPKLRSGGFGMVDREEPVAGGGEAHSLQPIRPEAQDFRRHLFAGELVDQIGLGAEPERAGSLCRRFKRRDGCASGAGDR